MTIRSKLLKWYRAHRRDLPWRKSTDSYAVWISEIMLQQTQVETVIPYYRRFLQRFPTIFVLARARRDSVFRVWQGLGYYRRARQLHEAARLVVKNFAGQLPQTASELARLPGFGPYTSGAVASIAFGQPEPAIDGNVIRVLSRLFYITVPVTHTVVRIKIRPLAVGLMSKANAGDLNQALMELGALVCRPRQPNCPVCPVRTHCLALKRRRNPEGIPIKQIVPRRAKPVPIAIGIVMSQDRVLISKRPVDTILGGLWEFPGGKRDTGESLQDACIRELREETGLQVQVLKKMDNFVHHYSHYSVHLHFFACRVVGGQLKRAPGPIKWIRLRNLKNYAFPAANRRIIKTLLDESYSS